MSLPPVLVRPGLNVGKPLDGPRRGVAVDAYPCLIFKQGVSRAPRSRTPAPPRAIRWTWAPGADHMNPTLVVALPCA